MDAGFAWRPSRFMWYDPGQAGGRVRVGDLVFS